MLALWQEQCLTKVKGLSEEKTVSSFAGARIQRRMAAGIARQYSSFANIRAVYLPANSEPEGS
jgi:hypothetical protein